MLAIIETHPIQYHAPVYRAVRERFGIPLTVIYGSDFSVEGGLDREFGKTIAWDTDLLSGYESIFLSCAADGGARNDAEVSAKGLHQKLQQLNPKAVMLVGYSPRFHQSAFYEAWRLGRPILFRGETTDHATRRSRIKSGLRDLMLRQLYGRCARLLFVGENSRRHFARLGCTSQKMIFSPYCVDTAPFQCEELDRQSLREATRQALGIAASDLVILFSGKISFRKGPDLLLAALKHLPEDFRQRVVLLFLGDGELREQLQAGTARCPVRTPQRGVPTIEIDTSPIGAPEVRACFVGFKNQSELSPFYHCADLLALPSRFGETWGLVVNEALHHGVPAIVSDAVGCAPDLIEPGATGEVFDANSMQLLASAIQRALRLAGRAEIRAACRAKVSGYSVEKAAAGIASAYQATIKASWNL